MCTLLTLSKDYFDGHRAEVNERIRRDHVQNDDGASLILVDDKQVVLMSLASMSIAPILSLINATKWHRMFVHQRMATGGAAIVGNCHGWATRDDGAVHVMHNGILHTPDSHEFAVDSQAIVRWLELNRWETALGLIADEYYANVFLIINGRGHTVIRSETGALMTDGLGNYSTNYIKGLHHEVPVGAFGTGATKLTWKAIHAADDAARQRVSSYDGGHRIAYTSTGAGGNGELWVPDAAAPYGMRRLSAGPVPRASDGPSENDEPRTWYDAEKGWRTEGDSDSVISRAWRAHEQTEAERAEFMTDGDVAGLMDRADIPGMDPDGTVTGLADNEDEDDDDVMPVDVAVRRASGT